MDFRFPFLSLISGIIILGVIPFGLAQLDPDENAYMEIDMLNGQTENPFRIQDENNVDVFCIDTDGYIACGGSAWNEFYFFNDGSEVTVSCLESEITTSSHECVLAEWEISTSLTRSSSTNHQTQTVFAFTELKRDSGAGTCNMELQTWDGGSWNTQAGTFLSGSPASYFYGDNFDVQDSTNGEVTKIRFIAYVSVSPTTCSFKNFGFNAPILFPPDYTITKVT